MGSNSNPKQVLVRAVDLSKKVLSPDGSELTILESVSMELAEGEATAILGASGSGKSTLLGLLAGLDNITNGEVQLFGQSLSSLDEDRRAALRAGKVGFVFQSFQLLPGMSALENVMLPLELANHPQARSRAATALESVGLDQRMSHYPAQLSGGEQQRVALARAFASEPELLFADEPTGSLDQHTGKQITELMFKLRAETGTTLLLVTHDEELASRCDRRLLLEEGRLESQQ